MDRFARMKVYRKLKREVAQRDKSGKIIGVRWVDIMKNGECKSRLCAQAFAGKNDRDDLFASTPPLMATKCILSNYCSNGKGGAGGRKIMILDIKSAFLYGYMEDTIYIELPPRTRITERVTLESWTRPCMELGKLLRYGTT